MKGKDIGSGAVYREDKDYLYVITAGHVVEPLKTEDCQCVFYPNGRPLAAVPAVIETRDYVKPIRYSKDIEVNDLATLRVSKSKFKSPNDYPKAVPLAGPDTLIKVNDSILSIGCSGPYAPLHYPSMFNGYVSELVGNTYYIQPNLIEGRSGSAVFDKTGERIIGVAIWRSNWGGRIIGPKSIFQHLVEE